VTTVDLSTVLPDAYDASRAAAATGSLRAFNEAGILAPADVHVAQRLTALAGAAAGDGDTDAVALGLALAARAPRLGHVCVDLTTVRDTASTDSDQPTDVASLPWPEAESWRVALAASPLVGEGRPLQLVGSTLYLRRLWLDETHVAAELLDRAASPVGAVDVARLRAGVDRLFVEQDPQDADSEHLQPLAAALAVLRRVTVIAGGPGTGKTTTVARLLALLDEQAAASGGAPPFVALSAPTGKAALRLEEAVHGEADTLGLDPGVVGRLQALRGTTLHRLLGRAGGSRTRFRHDRSNPLRHDVVVVDETSMVSLSMMARLLEAVRPEARLILVGDPEQLASVEAGAVLGDIVGPASSRLRLGTACRVELEAATGVRVAGEANGASPIGDGVVVLRHVRRHKGAIARFARAIQAGDASAAVDVLRDPGAEADSEANIEWLPYDASDPSHADQLDRIHDRAVENGRRVIDAARAGEAEAALDALEGFRLLCAHRRGPDGVATWTAQIERWLQAEVDGFGTGEGWYIGRPLIVTENDYSLDLFNGDIGVVVAGTVRAMEAAFRRGGRARPVSTTRLAAVDTVYAMTVHKSQGSQFREVAFLVPDIESRILTRELLYTAVTRAQERLILVGSEERIRAAIERPVSRASGLRHALWGD
jgi:exodeoxyribonuclease V alpha subunit